MVQFCERLPQREGNPTEFVGVRLLHFRGHALEQVQVGFRLVADYANARVRIRGQFRHAEHVLRGSAIDAHALAIEAQ